jgi:hypothetical protein
MVNLEPGNDAWLVVGPIAGIEARAIESPARRPNDRARRLRFFRSDCADEAVECEKVARPLRSGVDEARSA